MSIRALASATRIDHGYKKMQADFKRLATSPVYVKAGVLGGKSRPDGKLTNAQIAIWMENGTSKTPARPFIMPAFLKHRAEYMHILAALTKKFYGGEGAHFSKVLGIIGTQMAADMKAFVTKGPEVQPTNAESTKRRKQGKNARRSNGAAQGDTRTLVDTGRMVGSISHEVVGGAGEHGHGGGSSGGHGAGGHH